MYVGGSEALRCSHRWDGCWRLNSGSRLAAEFTGFFFVCELRDAVVRDASAFVVLFVATGAFLLTEFGDAVVRAALVAKIPFGKGRATSSRNVA